MFRFPFLAPTDFIEIPTLPIIHTQVSRNSSGLGVFFIVHFQELAAPTEQACRQERAQTTTGKCFRMSVHVHAADIPCHLGGTGDIEMNATSPLGTLFRLVDEPPTTESQALKEWYFARGAMTFQAAWALVRI